METALEPKTGLSIRHADMTTVHLCDKVVGAAFFPVCYALGLLGMALGAFYIDTSLVAEYQFALVGALMKRGEGVGALAVAAAVGEGECTVDRAINSAGINTKQAFQRFVHGNTSANFFVVFPLRDTFALLILENIFMFLMN